MANWLFNREIKQFLGADDPDYTDEDGKISFINQHVTATLENLLGRSLSKVEYTEYHDSKQNGTKFHDVYGFSDTGYGTAYKQVKYYLKNYPIDVDAGFEVHYSPNALVDGSTLLAESEYILDAEKGELIILKPVANVRRGLKIVYTAGYEDTVDEADGIVEDLSDPTQERALSASLPVDLVQAALWQAMHVYEKTKFSNINVRESRSQGSTNSTRYVNIHALAPESMAIIVQHKRRNFKVV